MKTHLTHRLHAWNAQIVILNILQLFKRRTVSCVVVPLQGILSKIAPKEVGNIHSIANVLITVLVREHTQGDREAVRGTMRTNVGHLTIGMFYLRALKVARVLVDETKLHVPGTGIILWAGTVVTAKRSMFFRVLEFFKAEVTLALTTILEPLVVNFEHAILAVGLVLFVPFLLPLEHHLKVVLNLDHVFSVVGLATLTAGTVHFLRRAIVVVGCEGVAVVRVVVVIVVLEVASTATAAA